MISIRIKVTAPFCIFVFFSAVLLAMSGCRKGDSGSADGAIKIGALFDLTGPTSDVGAPYAAGLRDFVDWRNAKGGINGRKLALLSGDYGYKVDRAEQLYTQHIQQGVIAFQGWGTGDTEALRAKIRADKIPFMSASYSTNLLDMKEAPYNFLVGTSYSDQAIIAIRWAIDHWKASGKEGTPKVALLHHDSPFGQSPIADAKAFAGANGVAFTSLPMPRGATELVAELGRVKQFGGNYVLIQNVSSPVAVLLKDARRQGLHQSMTFICLNWCAGELLLELAGDATEGLFGAMPFTPPSVPVPGHQELAKWLEKQGSTLTEKGVHYVQGWWTQAVMVAGIERAVESGKTLSGESVRQALETMNNFDTQGVTTPITFSPTSHRGNDSMRLFQVKGGKWQQISDYIKAEP